MRVFFHFYRNYLIGRSDDIVIICSSFHKKEKFGIILITLMEKFTRQWKQGNILFNLTKTLFNIKGFFISPFLCIPPNLLDFQQQFIIVNAEGFFYKYLTVDLKGNQISLIDLNYLNTFLLLLLVLANYSNLYLTHFKKRR